MVRNVDMIEYAREYFKNFKICTIYTKYVCIFLKKVLVHSMTSTKFIQMHIFTVPGACEIRVLICSCVYEMR